MRRDLRILTSFDAEYLTKCHNVFLYNREKQMILPSTDNKVNYLQGITKDYQPTEAFKYLSGIVLDDTKSPSSSYFFSIRSFISEIDTPPPQI